MAGDVQLKLQVGLDLAFLRNQLSTIGTQLGGQPLQINVKFDRQKIANEYRLLNRYLGNKTFRASIETNLQAEIRYAEKLRDTIKEISAIRTTGAAMGVAARKAPGIDILANQSRAQLLNIRKLFKEAGVPVGEIKNLSKATSDQLKASLLTGFESAGEDAVKGLFAGLKDESSKSAQIAAKIGADFLNAYKKWWGIASPSRKAKDELGKPIGEGIGDGIEDGLREAQSLSVGGIRRLFNALKGETQRGATELSALMAASMAGIVQLPGGRQQRARLQQTGGSINAAMTGPALPNIQSRQSSIRQQTASASTISPSLLASLPILFGMKPQEVQQRMSGLYGQRYAAPRLGGYARPNDRRINGLIELLASARGGLGAGSGSLVTKGPTANLPGILSTGYRNAAISPQFVNYPVGMPAAYGAGFVGASTGRFNMARPERTEPAVMGAFAAELNRAVSAVQGFRYSLGKQTLALPSAGMTGTGAAQSRRLQQAYQRSEARSAAVLAEDAARLAQRRAMEAVAGQVPLGGGGLSLPPGGGGGRGGGAGGGGFAGFNGPNFGGIGRAMTSFNRASSGISLPGGNAIRELGDEFKYATQQVLLFGTAYKGLAFLMGFPQQVGEAVASLQNFRNSLGAISPTAQEAAESNAAILDLVDRYNIPLQSARDGFVKLYASMQPAGFDGDEIRGLFEGISKAAATYGMSADKVDRVTYAFAQMASKGQVMSEELKGQLGDVLPGAMALFAKAAGFDGPDAISKFSEALEDGAYKGQAMTALLKNVTLVMNKEFGPGAEGAALTFQGVVNRLQNSMTLLYESFEPVAVGFLNQVVVPLTRGIKEVTDGVNAFLTGASTTTTGGFAIAQELEKLRPSFEGIRQNVTALIQQFGQFAQVALEIGKIFLQIAGNPIVGYLGRLYAIVLPLNIALNVMRGLWASNALQFIIFNARVATGTSTLGAFRAMMAATGATAQATGLTIRTFFATTGVGLVVAGIGILIERFMTLEQRLANVREKAVGAAQAIRAMTSTEARAEEQRATKALKLVRRLQGQQALYPVQNKADERVGLSEADAQLLEGMGIPVAKGLGGGRSLARMNLEGIAQKIDTLYLSEARSRQQQLKFEEKQTEQQLKISPVAPSAKDDGKGGGKDAKTPLGQVLDYESRRKAVMRASDMELHLTKRINEAKLSGNEQEAESLENLRRAVALRGELAELQAYQKMLIDKEQEIVGKSLTSQEYNNKLQDANVAVYEKQNQLQAAYSDLSTKESLNLKKRAEDLLSYQRTLEDVRIENGLIPEAQAKQIKLARQYEDIIKQYPFLTAQQKIELQAAIFAQQDSLSPLTEKIKEIRQELEKLRSTQEMVKGSAEAIGDSFAQSFKDTISGAQTAQQALASFFQRIGDYFLDMAARMIQKWIEMQIIGLVGSLIPSGGGLLTSGLSGGFSTSSAFSMAPGSVPAAGGITMPSFTGGIGGGIQGFANGGMVTGPTLGLVGEGRYNEAIVPLPDGKSIPVDLGGAAGNQIVSNITVNVSNGQAQSNATGANSSELGRKLEGAVKQVIIGELRPGGLLSR